ncbi:hypothetical protein J6Z19_07275 [bacterium]|nr:hypothetical protein [bacterium]
MSKPKENVTRIPDFRKIHFLNNYKINEKTFLNKYISFKHLEENITKNEIVFVSPKTWRDPYEQIYYTAENYAKYNNYKKPNIFCMCLTENSSQNEDAAWKIYQDTTNEKMIKVTFNVTEMLKQLDQYCFANNFSIYVGKIKYILSRDITTLSKQSNTKHQRYFPKKNFSDTHYLKLLLLKRKAFEFEREVRIFLIPDDKNEKYPDDKNAKYPDDIFRIPQFPYNNETISRLKIAPLQPFPLGDPRQASYAKLQEYESEIYKEALKNLLPREFNSEKIRQSILYKPRKIKKL